LHQTGISWETIGAPKASGKPGDRFSPAARASLAGGWLPAGQGQNHGVKSHGTEIRQSTKNGNCFHFETFFLRSLIQYDSTP
jgi:hypothetical protein